jgi:hypothetical protein
LLNIAAAQGYYGWEKSGRMGSMQLSLDPETLQMTLSMSGDVSNVPTFNGASITSDFFGVRTGEARVPGPFADVSQPFKGRSVDPRGQR